MEDFVTFEIARKLKEKGFIGNGDIGCYYGFYCEKGTNIDIVYDDLDNSELLCDEYLRPSISQVLKWLREEKRISVEKNFGMHPYKSNACWYCTIVKISESGTREVLDNFGETCNVFDSYEQAALTGIEYVLNNLI